MRKKQAVLKALLFTFMVSVLFIGNVFCLGQGIETVSAATNTTKSKEVSCKKTMYCKASSLNVRKSANANAKKVTTIKYKAKITVIATIKESSWVKIKTSNGKVGYVNVKYLSTKKPTEQNNSSSKPKDDNKNTRPNKPDRPDRPPQSPDDIPDGDGF